MLLVVGGHSRNIGKTSVACGIIRGLPEFNWTAVKITQVKITQVKITQDTGPVDPERAISLTEERGLHPASDSGRFLAAGAARAFWLRTPAGHLGDALPQLMHVLEEAENAIVESNSVLEFLQPELYLMVLDGAVADFKTTSRRFLDRADALVATSEAPFPWPDVSAGVLDSKPCYFVPAPGFESLPLNEFLRNTRHGNRTSPLSRPVGVIPEAGRRLTRRLEDR